ncbi:LysE/ArgO family amino acid transporter [Granulosicoccus antarcticus]|uniref:Arginine exporter protein ArgO n=1 Tax=Granulosicoccus antarcticus IMCC3135 TaxID=1192854 RepID=A0A2Z2P234_9GAMM|nr:LysE/ArgO family amino acid transporter [Granulosicoccus antarcticus]ASJ76328.1 Arginine exporter protein ArgO [Granulosicoccus antarcticus IMCC3135]
MLAALTAGFFLGASLIIAIGSQNAFVLRQGLRGEHVALICLTCAFSDALLITAGVFGFGELVEHSPWIAPVARYGGAAFLLGYALLAFVSAWRGGGTLEAAERAAPSWKVALLTCLALTWLNPHVYLDTLVLLGAASVKYEAFPSAFAIGAVCASFLFFFSLGYGARLLQPLFARPMAWRILDVVIGVVMLLIAASLLR